MRCTTWREAYWNGYVRQDHFWYDVRAQERVEQPEVEKDMPQLEDVDD